MLMNLDLDLNIDNYNISELENFLSLSGNYTFNDIYNNDKKNVEILISNNGYDNNVKSQIINFMSSAKNKLIAHIKKITEQTGNFIENFDEIVIKKDENNVINQTTATTGGYHYVINKETTSINDAIDKEKYLNPLETYNTNIARSNLNKIKRKTINQTIVLNSLYREDYANTLSTDFTIFLNNYFKNVLSIRLSSIQLPNVIYCISQANRNNTLYISENGTGIEGIIIVPDGNYDIATFASVLNTNINTQLGSVNFIVTHNTYTQKITISNIVNTFTLNFGKTTIPNTNTPKDYIINKNYKQYECVDITEPYKLLGWVIGYRKIVYTGLTSYETEGLFNSSFTNYIYFVMNDFNYSQAQTIIGMFAKSTIKDDILAVIPLTSDSFNICFDNGSDFIEKKREYFGPVNIQRLKIQLYNQYGEILNLNSMDFSFSLEIELGYDW